MPLSSRTPLAWLNLTHDKRRLGVAVSGVTFAVLLMFMEMGFWNAMMDSTVTVLKAFDAQLVLVNRMRYSFHLNEPLARLRLSQAAEVPGVRDARPLYVEYFWSLWKSREPHRADEPSTRPIRVLAFDPSSPVLNLPELAPQAQRLGVLDTVLMDLKGRDWFGPRVPDTYAELGGHRVKIVGNFALGTDFTADGNLLISDVTFAHLFPQRAGRTNPLGQVDLGLVRVVPGVDPKVVETALRRALPDDVAVFTKQEFIDQEKAFWQRSTPIGFVFFLGLIMGFVVGVIICYQILSADILDHLPEFATLKAIGYPNRFLSGVVLREALLLAVFGFLPGAILARGLYNVLENGTGVPWLFGTGTGLPMEFTWHRDLLILGLTLIMCLTSGLIAIRKVQTADPAEVF